MSENIQRELRAYHREKLLHLGNLIWGITAAGGGIRGFHGVEGGDRGSHGRAVALVDGTTLVLVASTARRSQSQDVEWVAGDVDAPVAKRSTVASTDELHGGTIPVAVGIVGGADSVADASRLLQDLDAVEDSGEAELDGVETLVDRLNC